MSTNLLLYTTPISIHRFNNLIEEYELFDHCSSHIIIISMDLVLPNQNYFMLRIHFFSSIENSYNLVIITELKTY